LFANRNANKQMTDIKSVKGEVKMDLRAIFASAEGGVLNYEGFESAIKTAGIKLADLSTGNYVARNKYDDDIKAKDDNIKTLNETITQRDADLAGLKQQLTDAGTDAKKLGELTTKFNDLQTKYDTDTKDYQAKLKQVEYEYAVKDFANGKNFTSNAAKRDFIQSMIAKGLNLENGKIIGGDDFTTGYLADNPDAFVKEQETQPVVENKPQFVSSTDQVSTPNPDATNGFAKAFNFTPIRGIAQNNNK